jgi:2-isopropylmalate synthase
VLDEDLLAVLQTGGVTDNGQRFELVSLEVTCGGTRSFARVQLTDSVFPTQEAVAEGNGPLAAAFTSIDQLVDVDVVLEDMTIIPATSGGDAVGKVHLKASVEGKSFTGRGASTDIVLAAAQAYLHIINKAVQFGVARPHAFEFAHNFWGV